MPQIDMKEYYDTTVIRMLAQGEGQARIEKRWLASTYMLLLEIPTRETHDTFGKINQTFEHMGKVFDKMGRVFEKGFKK